MSKIIEFSVPQVYFEKHFAEVPDDFELEQLSWEERVNFMYNHMNEGDKQWIGIPVPDKDQKKAIDSALDAGYAYIKVKVD